MSGLAAFISDNKLWISIAIAVVVIGIIIVVIVVIAKRKKNQPASESFTEYYTGTDNYVEQFKYAESYVNSVLGV